MNTRSNPLSTSENEHGGGIGCGVSDEELDDLLRQAMCEERMPEDLPAATLSFIHVKAEKTAQHVEASVPASEGSQLGAASPDVTPEPTPLSLSAGRSTVSPRKPAKARRSPSRRVLFRDALHLMAACLVIGAMAAAGFAFAGETAQVELDGGTTVEIGLNRWGRVVRVETSDASLQSSVDELGIGGQSCGNAVEVLLASDEVVDALGGSEGLSITVSGDDASQREETLSVCARAAEGAGCGGRCSAVDSETREEAQLNGMGVGRYALYLEIAALDSEASVEDCRDLTMRELRFLLAEVQGGASWQDALAKLAESGGVGAGCGSGSGSGLGHGKGNGAGSGAGGGMGRGRGMGQGSGANQG